MVVRAARAKRSSVAIPPFEVVGVDYAAFDCLLEHTAERKKRGPSPQVFLIEALLACYMGKNLL